MAGMLSRMKTIAKKSNVGPATKNQKAFAQASPGLDKVRAAGPNYNDSGDVKLAAKKRALGGIAKRFGKY